MLKIDWGTMWVNSFADICRSHPNEVGALKGKLVGTEPAKVRNFVFTHYAP